MTDSLNVLLGWTHRQHPQEFKTVLGIRGRQRKYFGKSAQELEESGKSVKPQQIPDSSYWVVSNNDTPKKRQILGDVLGVLGYSSSAAAEAVRSLSEEEPAGVSTRHGRRPIKFNEDEII